MADTPLEPSPEGSIVFFVDDDGRVLLQQRDDSVPPAGYGRWAFPGGRREPGETPEMTARREILEEIGVAVGGLQFIETLTPGTDSGFHRRLHLFLSEERIPRAAITVKEGLDFQYWSRAETAELPMNPASRAVLEHFFASDHYQRRRIPSSNPTAAAGVIEIDRWGRLLLQLRDDHPPPFPYPAHWTIPGGEVEPDESPDAAALREFEEETGHLLETIRFFRAYSRRDLPSQRVDWQHVYYIDADLDEAIITVREGQAFRYFAPVDLDGLRLTPDSRTILAEFVAAGAYRAMFH